MDRDRSAMEHGPYRASAQPRCITYSHRTDDHRNQTETGESARSRRARPSLDNSLDVRPQVMWTHSRTIASRVPATAVYSSAPSPIVERRSVVPSVDVEQVEPIKEARDLTLIRSTSIGLRLRIRIRFRRDESALPLGTRPTLFSAAEWCLPFFLPFDHLLSSLLLPCFCDRPPNAQWTRVSSLNVPARLSITPFPGVDRGEPRAGLAFALDTTGDRPASPRSLVQHRPPPSALSVTHR